MTNGRACCEQRVPLVLPRVAETRPGQLTRTEGQRATVEHAARSEPVFCAVREWISAGVQQTSGLRNSRTPWMKNAGVSLKARNASRLGNALVDNLVEGRKLPGGGQLRCQWSGRLSKDGRCSLQIYWGKALSLSGLFCASRLHLLHFCDCSMAHSCQPDTEAGDTLLGPARVRRSAGARARREMRTAGHTAEC